MGRLDEYSEEERAAMLGDKAAFMRDCSQAERNAWADAQLGRRVRELLACEEPPREFLHHVYEAPGEYTAAAWTWTRRELLGDSTGNDPNGSPASPTSIPPSSLPGRMEVDHVKPSGDEAFRPAPPDRQLFRYGDRLGFWTGEPGQGHFHPAADSVLDETVAAWNGARHGR